MQKIAMNDEPASDAFLTAIEKIRRQQDAKEKEEKKREILRSRNASRWKQILDQKEIEEFERYREEKNSQRAPINFVEGVNI